MSATETRETQVRGLESVVAAETRLGAVDGTAGTLHYTGYNIDELATAASFEETLYLLLHGDLPDAAQLAGLRAELKTAQADEEAHAILPGLPTMGAPIDALRTAVSVLAQDDPQVEDTSPDNVRRIGVRLAALMPVALAASERRVQGQEPVAPNPTLGHAANFLYMLHGERPSAVAERAMNTYLVLLTEHSLNASTFAARVAIGAGADAYAALVAAITTLKGDAHGGANRRAMEMLREIGRPERVAGYIDESLRTHRRVMGIGHRIYKTRDPRARVLEALARDLAAESGDPTPFDTARELERVTATHPYYVERKLYPNVEFFSAPVLHGLGVRAEAMPAVFALSRVAGWTAHILEQLADNRLIRPQARYVGPAPRPWRAVDSR
jgi:citrate synthase